MTAPVGPADGLRYDTEVDLTNDNMSQALVANLVGRGARVLDVGCATGATARAMAGLGCTVIGVEPDPEAAELARESVARMFVDTLEHLDLVAELGAGSQDAVVFGDVLEHLVDPVGALLTVEPLLAPGGAVVASVPHVAHGAVRLALLQGRFDYTPTGLLDETHLRFFTQGRLHEVLGAAGLVAVELRRTRLGLFETEIVLDEGDFEPALLQDVLADPEALTYQFVVRAIRTTEASDEQRVRARRWAEAGERGAAPSDRARPVGTGTVTLDAAPRVGIWGLFDLEDVPAAVRARVAELELGRRLPAAHLRVAAPRPSTDAAPLGDVGLEPLGPRGALGAQRWRSELDGVLVLGGADLDAPAAAALYADRVSEDHPALWLRHGAPEPVTTVRLEADLLPLVTRLLPAEHARRRVELLRLTGELPPGERMVVVQAGADEAGAAAAVAAALDALVADDPDLVVVVLEAEKSRGDSEFLRALATTVAHPTTVLTPTHGLETLLAVLATADAVVAGSEDVRTLADAHGTPTAPLAHLLEHGLPTGRGAGSSAARRRADAELDRVSAELAASCPPERRVDVAPRVVALERATTAVRRRTSDQLAAALAAVVAARETANATTADAVDAVELAARDREITRLQEHIVAMNSTRTMRVLRPAHVAFSRLRARTGR